MPLRFEGGLLGDLLVLASALAVIALLAFLVGDGGAVSTATLLAFFLLRNGYFLASELRNNGSTIGKRRLRLRVIDANGTPLTALRCYSAPSSSAISRVSSSCSCHSS